MPPFRWRPFSFPLKSGVGGPKGRAVYRRDAPGATRCARSGGLDVGVQPEAVTGVVLLLDLLQSRIVAAIGPAHALVVCAGVRVHVEAVRKFLHAAPDAPRRLDMRLILSAIPPFGFDEQVVRGIATPVSRCVR